MNYDLTEEEYKEIAMQVCNECVEKFVGAPDNEETVERIHEFTKVRAKELVIERMAENNKQ